MDEQVKQYATGLLLQMYSNDKALLAITEILKFSDNKHREFLTKVQEMLIKWNKK